MLYWNKVKVLAKRFSFNQKNQEIYWFSHYFSNFTAMDRKRRFTACFTELLISDRQCDGYKI